MGAGAAFVAARPLATLDSGDIANSALGVAGALAVVVAGWTTANPTLYRAGLALQVVSPNWPRWKVTLIAGVITTLVACSPFVFTRLLDFVGVYGVLLMPVGAIVFVEHWVFPRIGLTQFWASRRGLTFSWPALAAWFLALALGAWLWRSGTLHLFFLAVPVWLATAVLYVTFAALAGAREPGGPFAEPQADSPAPGETTASRGCRRNRRSRGPRGLRRAFPVGLPSRRHHVGGAARVVQGLGPRRDGRLLRRGRGLDERGAQAAAACGAFLI
jgi:NCS1 family nucleobase:cation symporter-1